MIKCTFNNCSGDLLPFPPVMDIIKVIMINNNKYKNHIILNSCHDIIKLHTLELFKTN